MSLAILASRMDLLIRLLVRFILVPLGATAAFVAAAAVIVMARRNALLAVLDADPQTQLDYLALLCVSAFYMLVPAAIGVLISEALAIRSWLFHAANGGFSVWLGWALTQDIRDQYRFFAEPGILIAAGFLAGFAYWVVSGWMAGFWKPVRSPRRPMP
jgi:hypothetical protein